MRSKRRKELACPERGFEPSAPSGRCSEGRIGRNREYCKRQRCKTTIFQPAFVAASATSRRRGCIGAALVCVNPSVNPPCGVLPAPRPGSLLVRFRSLHIKPALKGDSSRARPVGDAARGESGGIGSIASGSVARRPYSNQRCGFRVAKAGGVAARLLLFTSTPQSATPTASRKGEPYEERISLLAQAPFFDAEIHRRSCVGEKSQTFSLFRR